MNKRVNQKTSKVLDGQRGSSPLHICGLKVASKYEWYNLVNKNKIYFLSTYTNHEPEVKDEYLPPNQLQTRMQLFEQIHMVDRRKFFAHILDAMRSEKLAYIRFVTKQFQRQFEERIHYYKLSNESQILLLRVLFDVYKTEGTSGF